MDKKGYVSPMNRLSELKENKKLDNKGFSLVDLIIVIAIMAVLVGVLAPQYLKYVEKSRVASDRDNITAIKDAIQVYGADPDADATKPLANGNTVVLTRKGVTGAAINGDGVVEALKAAGLPSTAADLPSLSNKQKADKVTISITIDPTTGNVTVIDDMPE